MDLSILDRLQTAVVGAGMAKLSGKTRYLADQALNLLNKQGIGNYKPPPSLGKGKDEYNPRSRAKSRGDPLLGIDWYCEMPALAGGGSSTPTLGWEMVEEATLPMYDIEPMSNYKAGKLFHYPAHQNLGTLSLKLYEDHNGSSTNYIKAWQALIFDRETGLYNPPSKFKLNIKITMFDVAKKDAIILTYLKCWPQNIDAFNLVGGSSDRVVLGVTFSVDDVDISFPSKSSDTNTPSRSLSLDTKGLGLNISLPSFPALPSMPSLPKLPSFGSLF